MAANTQLDAATCRWCSTDVDRQQVVSRHQTSIGVVIYTRCSCGVLHAWLRAGDERLMASGAHPA